MKIPLLTFLDRYVNSPVDGTGFREQFDRGDAATRRILLDNCGLSSSDEEILSAILREDEHAVGGILAHALAQYGALRRNDGGDGADPLPLWPGVPIHIERVEPASASSGQAVTLDVHGWYFEGDPSALAVGFAAEGRKPVRAVVERCVSEGSFGRTVARVKVTIPEPGEWTVLVSNTAGSRMGTSVLPRAVTVT